MIVASIKPGVKLKNLCPQMALAHPIVISVFSSFGVPCVITSGNDSQHGEGSLHHCLEGKYNDGVCRALDYRTKYPGLDGKEVSLRNTVKEALGGDFDVVIEAIGTENEHLHVEYDPRP